MRRYLREWGALIKAVEQRLDARVYAYNPNVAVRRRDGSGAATLPLWLVKKIVDAGEATT